MRFIITAGLALAIVTASACKVEPIPDGMNLNAAARQAVAAKQATAGQRPVITQSVPAPTVGAQVPTPLMTQRPTGTARGEVPPQTAAFLAANAPMFQLYETVRGTTGWDIALVLYDQGAQWPDLFGLNVAAGLTKPDAIEVTPGQRPHHWPIWPGDLLVLPTNASVVLADIVRPYAAPPPPPPPAEPEVVEKATTPWWVFIVLGGTAFLLAFLYLRYLRWRNQKLSNELEVSINEQKASTRALLEVQNTYEAECAKQRERHARALEEQRRRHECDLEEQRQLNFQVRRAMMPPLPDGVEDALLAGPPMCYEGATEDNLEELGREAMLTAYERRHPGARADDLRFERSNTRRVLISSRLGETFQMKYGDGTTREVTLVREPGWIFDGRILRGEEVVEELPGICVVGFCANAFEYSRSWITGALVEPYEYAAVHTVPDWERIADAEQAATEQMETSDIHIRGMGGAPVVVEAGSDVYQTRMVSLRGRIDRASGNEVRIIEPETGHDEGDLNTEVQELEDARING